MMSLFFSGCSITWGDELKNQGSERYSTLVSKHYGCKHVNISQCGISNDCIVRNSINYLQNNKPDVVVIQFTVINRTEYFNYRKEIAHWTPQNIKTRKQRDYYVNTYNNLLGVENLWKNIFLFDAYCKSVGQKYVSIIADHYEHILYKPEKFYKIGRGHWRSLCKDYKPTFIHMDLFKHTMDNPTYYANGLDGGHPSAEGHQVIANKIIELIDAI